MSVPWHGFSYEPGPIAVEGAVFVDFQLTGHLPPDQAPTVIERDRLIMSARPGLNRKLLPLRVEPDSGKSYSGGRYLFDTYENARDYARWVHEKFAIDGTLFFERPDFAEVNPQVWRVIGAHDFKDVCTSQRVLRTERWTTDPSVGALLEQRWSTLLEIAGERDLSSLWLLHSDEYDQVTMLTVADISNSTAADQPDFASIAALEAAPSVAAALESAGGMTKVFDRTAWAFTIWFPYRESEDNLAAVWPNSPPLPAPSSKVEENAA